MLAIAVALKISFSKLLLVVVLLPVSASYGFNSGRSAIRITYYTFWCRMGFGDRLHALPYLTERIGYGLMVLLHLGKHGVMPILCQRSGGSNSGLLALRGLGLAVGLRCVGLLL